MLRNMFAIAAAALMVFPAAAQAAEDAKGSGKEKKVCRREVPTGSVMAKLTCRTKAEWEALSARGRSDLDRTDDLERSRSQVGANSGG